MTIACDVSDQATTTTTTADALAEVLASVLGVQAVEKDSDFFADLGADSMTMARFCARLRKRDDLPSPSMRDIYQSPTIASLATLLLPALDAAVAASAASGASGVVVARPDAAAVHPPGRLAAALCGALQMTWIVAYGTLTLCALISAYAWVSDGTGPLEMYVRSVVAGAGICLGLVTVPIILKWLLIGRWRSQEFSIWGLRYVRFWIVKTAIRSNPLALFAGSPLYVLYLRALGAKIGPGAVIFTRHLPVCTDLLTVGAGAVIRNDAFLSCYRARGRVIETGPVTLGAQAFVGEFTVLDIDTSMGERAQLGHSSSLHSGQSIPAHESWHGTPARPGAASYRLDDTTSQHAAAMSQRTVRRFGYGAAQVAFTVFVVMPVAGGLIEALFTSSPLMWLLDRGLAPTGGQFFLATMALCAVLFFGALAAGLLFVATVPRVLALGLTAGVTYPLYGVRYSLHRCVGLFSNIQPLTDLFGDSSYIVGYLRAIGYKLLPVEQTGSNFGQAVKHENPYLSTVGTGTMAADGLSILNAEYSAGAFRLLPTRIGAHSFLGNHVVYPSGARVGDNVLLATKVAVPLDGPVRQNVGLLGSPAFEIPRTVQRDSALGLDTLQEQRRRLRAKNRHNLVTMALHLALRFLHIYAVVVMFGLAMVLYPSHGILVLALLDAALLVVTVGYWVLVERCFAWMQVLAPQGCSIYDQAFWRHERYWKAPAEKYITALDGTPLKPLVWRLLGVRVGRDLFDDGCFLSERGFVSLGDDCTLNAGTVLQCHSQEDGAFKSDRTTLGSRCTVGAGSLVHYGVRIGDDVELAPDSFVMKGEEVPEAAHWAGNPARPAATTALPSPS